MDQRIGKVLMRSGFMDEFYGMEESIRSGKFLYTRPGGPSATLDSESPRDERTFLRVTNFRNYGEIKMNGFLNCSNYNIRIQELGVLSHKHHLFVY